MAPWLPRRLRQRHQQQPPIRCRWRRWRRTGSVQLALLWSTAGCRPAWASAALTPLERLRAIVIEKLPRYDGDAPDFVFRNLAAVGGSLAPAPQSPEVTSVERLQPDKCALLDIYSAGSRAAGGASNLDVASLQQWPFGACRFHVLWMRGRGGAMDWMVDERALCQVYSTLLVEDEFLLERWREHPPQCRVHPFDAYETPAIPLMALPWETHPHPLYIVLK